MSAATDVQVGMLVRNADGSVAWAPWERLPQEAVCPKCEQPIRWALDMFSFTTGFDDTHPFTLAHARCVWTDHAFTVEAVRARAQAIGAGKAEVGIRDAARILGVHENTIRNYIAERRLAARELPGSGYHRLLLADVIAFVEDFAGVPVDSKAKETPK